MRKILKVEGINDKKVIEKLLGRRKIDFENFEIQESPNVDRLLTVLPDMIRLGNYDVIGVIVDADEDLRGRWKSLQKILKKSGYDNIPNEPDERGIILKDENDELPIIGIWLMPDNKINGRIEDFIRFLVPADDELLPIAEKNVDTLIKKGINRFSVPHRSKALIHTWLAWQEKPGTHLGQAITYRIAKTQEHILDDGNASDFIEWLKKLFR